jgi:hypothetical protein
VLPLAVAHILRRKYDILTNRPLRQARPGDRFDVEILAEGKYVLTRLEPTKPQPSRVRFEKRNGYTVGISDRPVSEQAIRDALDEFPCLRTLRQSTGSNSALSTGELSAPRRS